MIEHRPLAWWVEKIRNNEYFSLARFGDGEFLCMQGRRGGNSHGCKYTPELKQDLLNILETPIWKGMQRITPQQFAEVRPMLKGEWYDTEVFADELAKGNLAPFFQAIAEKTVLIISSEEKEPAQQLFPKCDLAFVPRTNTHAEKDAIVADILKRSHYDVYLFACGMAAGTLISALHGMIPTAFLIDIGHILDPYCGELSREYMRHVPPDVMKQNYATT